MASFADLRPIIVIVCFLSLFLFFTSQMAASPEIWNTTEAQRINADSSFAASGTFYWNSTNGTTINHADDWTSDGMFGDVEVKLYTYTKDIISGITMLYPIFQIDSYSTWVWGPLSYQPLSSFEHFKWYRANDTAKTSDLAYDMGEDPNLSGSRVGNPHGLRIHDLDLLYGSSGSASVTYPFTVLTAGSVLQEVYKTWSLYYFVDGMIPTYYGVNVSVKSANFTNINVLKTWIDSYSTTSSQSTLSCLRFLISNSRTSSNVAFSFDEDTYGSPGAAWWNDALFVSFNNNYSEKQSGMNAFALIAGLLFWSLPGVPVEIYAIISFMVWPPIIYVAAIWVLRIIGSVFGGGASG